jgi:preprotein translocase subunit SecG
MLSFMRDQGAENLPGQKSTQNTGLGGAGAANDQGQEFLTVATRSKNVRKTTILAAVLFAIGLVCLWFMIRSSKPQSASAAFDGDEETQIELAISRLTGAGSEMLSRMDQIVAKFYEFSDVFQVEVDELSKNPFELEVFLSNLMKKMDKQEQDAALAAELRQLQQIQQEAEGLRILSIMQSDQGNCCMIDDKILHEGDSIRSFKIVRIGDSSVELEWSPNNESGPAGAKTKGMTITVKLSE